MKIVCISSSKMRFGKYIAEAIDEFEKVGIEAIYPNRLHEKHFESIDNCDAVYVINHGGYIGPYMSFEIGYALGIEKPIYFSEKANDSNMKPVAKGIIPICSVKRFRKL